MGFSIPVRLRSEEEGVSQKANPKSIVNAIRAFVGTALMKFKLPGAFSVPVTQTWQDTTAESVAIQHTLQGKIDFKALPGAMDGHFLYHMSGDLVLNGIPLRVNGNLPLPKDNRYYLDSGSAKLYAIAKKAVAQKPLSTSEQDILDGAMESMQSGDDASLSEGEETGDEAQVEA